jgi:hypothetical protein
MSPKRPILQSPIVVAPIVTLVIYGIYLMAFGRLSSHIMGRFALPFQLASPVTLSAALTWYFCRGWRRSNLVVAILAGLVCGYVSAVLSYIFAVYIWDFPRAQSSHYYWKKSILSFLGFLSGMGLILPNWLPGGLAGLATCLILRLMGGRKLAGGAT